MFLLPQKPGLFLSSNGQRMGNFNKILFWQHTVYFLVSLACVSYNLHCVEETSETHFVKTRPVLMSEKAQC